MSHSLGSGVALQMVQQFPDQYDGALLMCGIVGGSRVQVQYAGHVRALFDAFFPGMIPGSVIQVPPGTTVTLQQVIAAVSSNPAALYAIASMVQTPLPHVPGNVFDPSSAAFQTLVGSLYGQLRFQTQLANNVTELAHGSPFDNASTQYALGVPLLPPASLAPLVAFLNATVERYTIAPPAEDYLDNYFTSTGNLQMPVLTLHNRWDPGVPAFHEDSLAQRAADAGKTANLLQRLDNSFGHCALTANLAVSSFDDLVNWVATGTKPAS
jgi:pimeloyl-ACP methyl ester carboxylesterase